MPAVVHRDCPGAARWLNLGVVFGFGVVFGGGRVRRDEPDWLAGWREIQVDVASVQQLAAALSAEVRGGLAPQVDRVFQGYAPGTTFGRKNPSLELHAVRKKYNDCLTGTVEQLAAYTRASLILVAAATEIAFRYRSADELAAAKAEDIESILSTALTRALGSMDFGHGPAATGQVGVE